MVASIRGHSGLFKVFENEGNYADKYTVIIEGSIYAMSEHPSSPQGVNMYCGEISNGYKADGKEVEINDIPKEVKQAILERIPGEAGE